MNGVLAVDTIHDGYPVAIGVIANEARAQTTQTPRTVRISKISRIIACATILCII
jgi:hypothetical protein